MPQAFADFPPLIAMGKIFVAGSDRYASGSNARRLVFAIFWCRFHNDARLNKFKGEVLRTTKKIYRPQHSLLLVGK
jgi:hypothetical protein